MTTLDLAKEWLRYAKSDLNTARHMFKDVYPKEIEISSYHSHQCAEKSNKTYLFSKNIETPLIHDLGGFYYLNTVRGINFTAILQYYLVLNPLHQRINNKPV